MLSTALTASNHATTNALAVVRITSSTLKTLMMTPSVTLSNPNTTHPLRGNAMNVYSQWFFDYGWLLVTAIGAALGWEIGLKAYLFVLPAVLIAIIGK